MDASKLPLPENEWWAKCDCIASVSFKRLDRVKLGRDPRTGKRLYYTQKVYWKDLEAIKLAVANHLGMSDLISSGN